MIGFGAFGKMPAIGDFLRIDLPPSFVAPWDRWLQDGLSRARADLRDRWNGCYTTAPIWRFTLTAGLAGPATALGVVMPSVDRVGRQFPLTAVAALPAGRSAVQTHLTATATFEALELIVLDALGDAMTPRRLAERLHGVRMGGHPAQVTSSDSPRHTAITAAPGADAGAALAACESARRYRAPSVWTAELDGETRLLLTEGLPGLDIVHGLFDLQAPVWSAPASARGTRP